jgi:predicted  nucleic acid-binding Zn-ribbon protein
VAESGESADELQELQAYREKILEHLKEREHRMQDIEKELSKVAFMLKEYGVQKLVRSGNVRVIMRGEAFREGLSKDRDKLIRKLTEARSEVALARERLALADSDIVEAKRSAGVEE